MRKKVLVVEDEIDIQEIIRYLLTESGYQVGQCPNAEQFLSELQHLDPDLILMDVMLPDGNGMGLCKKVDQKLSA
ncbi:response regulator transcription factor [Desertivirga arenae]|uniref:response regulator transcription factor n=1 Tax=Desertivirga arenae TaxID=2810309 RepID=UPI001A968455|nr:response regulator [Pedobacter sp. SYSU D00823]